MNKKRTASARRGVRLFALTLVAVLGTTALSAADYYVDNTVSASGDGSIGSPFKTIQEGINQLGPGDTAWIRGNPSGQVYDEELSTSVDGTSTQPITVRVYPGEKVIVTGSSGRRLDIDKSHWIFDGLTLDQNGVGSDAVRIDGCSHITIRNAEIRNGAREGVSIEDTSFVTIEDSYIHNFMRFSSGGDRQDAHCIMIDTDRGPDIHDIHVNRNVIERCSGDGIQIFATTGQAISTYARDVSIVGNTFIDGTTTSGLTENALDFKGGDNVLVQDNTMSGYKNNKTVVVQKGCRNFNFEGNTITGGLSGIEMRQEGGSAFIQINQRVVGNLIHDMSSYALKFDGVNNLTVLNNTIANVDGDSFRFDSSLGSSTPAVDGAVIKNNLIQGADSPSGASDVANADVGYNGWFGANSGGLGDSTDTSGSDPLFVNPSAADFNLQPGSPAIDAGTPVGLTFSGSAPDLGAFENGSGGNPVTPAPPTGLEVR